MKTLGRYQITYLDKKFPVIQEKNLISHKDYTEIIKPKREQIYQFELNNDKKSAKKLKNEILSDYGDIWFTDESPLGKVIETNKLELVTGSFNVKIEKL